MNKLAAALISACLMCAGSAVYAQDAMSKDAMSHDTSGVDAPPKHHPFTMAMVGFGNIRSLWYCQSCASKRN